MTSNQVQAQANVETERHNKVVEAYNDKQLQISQQLADIDDMYKRNSLRLKERELDIEQRYKEGTTQYNQKMADIAKERMQAEAIHQSTVDEYERVRTQLTDEFNKAKIAYDERIAAVQEQLASAKVNEVTNMQQRLILDTFTASSRLQLDALNLQQHQIEWQAELPLKVFSGVAESFKALGQGMASFGAGINSFNNTFGYSKLVVGGKNNGTKK